MLKYIFDIQRLYSFSVYCLLGALVRFGKESWIITLRNLCHTVIA